MPLQKLAKSVPHGQKGPDVLDMLYANKVPVPRALWYIRVLGAIEIVRHFQCSFLEFQMTLYLQQVVTRNKNNVAVTQPHTTSTEWTNILTSYVRKQLLDIAIPVVTRTGANIKQIFRKSKLSERESREAWVSRFAYTCVDYYRSIRESLTIYVVWIY